MNANSEPYVTLRHALNKIFELSTYRSCLLTVGMNTVAILMLFPSVLKIFYPHSRDLHGVPCAFGYAVLISIEGLENLVDYFRLTSCLHSAVNSSIPFELKGVKCMIISENTFCRKNCLQLNPNLSFETFEENVVGGASNNNTEHHLIRETNGDGVQKHLKPTKQFHHTAERNKKEILKKEHVHKRAFRTKKFASEMMEERQERLKKVRVCKRASRMKRIVSETIKGREERLEKERACKRALTMKRIASETIKERRKA